MEKITHLNASGAFAHPSVRFLLEGDRAVVREFYPHAPTMAGVAEVAAVRATPKAPAAALVGDAWSIVTGQQAGLFGGPLMVVWKALTVIALARRVSAHLGGVDVVPVFWAATEDHDLDEIRVVHTLDSEGKLRRRSHTFLNETGDMPAQAAVLGDEILPLLDQVIGELPASDWKRQIATELRETYTPAATAGDAFVALLRRWFGRFGLWVIEPKDVARYHFEPIKSELDSPRAAALANTAGERLRALGLPAPLELRAETQSYGIRGAHRVRGRIEKGDQPSAGAALRPAWQDGALAVLAMVGGPSEVAYMAQLRRIHDAHGAVFPVVWPRASGTLIEPGIHRILASLGLTPQDLLGAEGDRGLIDTAAREAAKAPQEFHAVLDKLSRQVKETFTLIEGGLDRPADLARPLSKTVGTINEALDRFRARLDDHHAERAGIDSARRLRLHHSILPQGEFQERVLSPLPFLARHGPELFDRMLAAIDPERFAHVVIEL